MKTLAVKSRHLGLAAYLQAPKRGFALPLYFAMCEAGICNGPSCFSAEAAVSLTKTSFPAGMHASLCTYS